MSILYYGMENKPIEVIKRQHINNRYQTITEYFTLEGKEIMLKATKDAIAYSPAFNYMQYPNYSMPIIHAGMIVSPDILDRGYSSHDFNIIIN